MASFWYMDYFGTQHGEFYVNTIIIAERRELKKGELFKRYNQIELSTCKSDYFGAICSKIIFVAQRGTNPQPHNKIHSNSIGRKHIQITLSL